MQTLLLLLLSGVTASHAGTFDMGVVAGYPSAADAPIALGVQLGVGGRISDRGRLTGQLTAVRDGVDRFSTLLGPELAWDLAGGPETGWELAAGAGGVGGAGLGATAWFGGGVRRAASEEALVVGQARTRGEVVSGVPDLTVELIVGIRSRTRPAAVPVEVRKGKVHPPNAMVWVPHPVCEWIPATTLADPAVAATPRPPAQSVTSLLRGVRSDDPVLVSAPGFLPERVHLVAGEPIDVALEPAPVQGTLLLLSWPGDEVVLQGRRITDANAGPDGVVQVTLPEGAVQVHVVGGGREVVIESAVASGYAVWLRAPAPVPVRVPFSLNSAVLGPDASSPLEALAALRGGWRYEVVGSASPEGARDVNVGLAGERARAVVDWLVSRGVSREAVVMRVLEEPEAGLTAEQQRAVQVIPLSGDTP